MEDEIDVEKQRVQYDVLLELLASKLDIRIDDIKSKDKGKKKYQKLLPENGKQKFLLLGSYGLEAIAKAYQLPDLKVSRFTDDIDVYNHNAAIISDAVSPTGGRINLTDEIHGEIVSWISGMDRKGSKKDSLEYMIDNGMKNNGKLKKVKESKNCMFYAPSPQIFIINKLFSYRQGENREKDIEDVGQLLYALVEDGMQKEFSSIQKAVVKFGISNEFIKALGIANKYFEKSKQKTLSDY